jgi:hypothetical protein
MKWFVHFALYQVPTGSVGTWILISVAWTDKLKSIPNGIQLTGNKLISTCKSLKKILSYIVGDCPCNNKGKTCDCSCMTENARYLEIDVNVITK